MVLTQVFRDGRQCFPSSAWHFGLLSSVSLKQEAAYPCSLDPQYHILQVCHLIYVVQTAINLIIVFRFSKKDG